MDQMYCDILDKKRQYSIAIIYFAIQILRLIFILFGRVYKLLIGIINDASILANFTHYFIAQYVKH
jgi:hypothetical protein